MGRNKRTLNVLVRGPLSREHEFDVGGSHGFPPETSIAAIDAKLADPNNAYRSAALEAARAFLVSTGRTVWTAKEMMEVVHGIKDSPTPAPAHSTAHFMKRKEDSDK